VKAWHLSTKAVHAGRTTNEDDFTPTVPPIHPAVTYTYPSMDALDDVFAGERDGYVYARYGNPTVTAFEDAVASLEDGKDGRKDGRENGPSALAFGSGMAAVYAALLAVGATQGSTILAARDLYGATHTLLTDLMTSQGVSVHFVDAADTTAVEAACAQLQPAALLVETISNPLLKLADLPALAEAAHNSGARFLVDSTFATPVLVRPLALGADVVIHSATKYLAGHGDVLGGVIVTNRELRDRAHGILKLTGGNLSPHDAWLALRGVRTLALRMREHCANALQLARWLSDHPRVSRVHYPGLPGHPQHDLANQLFADRGYGGMVSFEIAGAAQPDVFRFFEALELAIPGTTLGDVHTLLLYPAHASHRTLTPEARAEIGISDGLVRVSVGIESIHDITADLDQALAATRP